MTWRWPSDKWFTRFNRQTDREEWSIREWETSLNIMKYMKFAYYYYPRGKKVRFQITEKSELPLIADMLLEKSDGCRPAHGAATNDQ